MSTRDVVRRVSWVAMLCGLAVVAPARPASACSCAMRAVCAAFWEADRVFIGRAEVTPLGPGAQLTRFRVEESFRGPAGVIEIVARGIGGSCAYAFVHGTRYLVFARRAADGTWSSFFCDPIAPLDQAGESLRFARDVSRDTRHGGRVFGSVTLATRAPKGQVTSASPLGGAMLTLRRGPYVRSATADATGVFELRDVPPGLYSLTIAPVTDTESQPAVPIEIKGPGACVGQSITVFRRPTASH